MKAEIFVFQNPDIREQVQGRQVLEVSRTLLSHDGLILLLKRKGTHFDDYWELPGGKGEPGFDSYGTAGKEILEETGMNGQWSATAPRDFIFIESLTEEKLLHVMEFDANHPLMPGSRYDKMMVVTHVTEATAFTKKVVIDQSCHSDFMWIKPENALRRYADTLTPYTEFALQAVVAKKTKQQPQRERLDHLPVIAQVASMPTETTAQSGDFLTAALR